MGNKNRKMKTLRKREKKTQYRRLLEVKSAIVTDGSDW